MSALCVGGETLRIGVGMKVYEFEMHWLGPMPVNKKGNERKLGPRHKFWQAVTWWNEQGRPVGDDGLCVWSAPAPLKLRHLGGRHYLVLNEE